MMMKLIAGVAAALLASLTFGADLPEYYRLLADDYKLPYEGYGPPRPRLGFWQPTEVEKKAGFGVGLADIEVIPQADWVWAESHPRREIRLIGQWNEFRAQPVVVRSLRDLKDFRVEKGELVSENGNKIGPENIDVRQVKYRYYHTKKTEVREGNFLVAATPGDMEKDHSRWLWFTFYVPPATPGGIYRGEITFKTADSDAVSLPVKLRVAEREFRYPEGSWGYWLPANFLVNNGKSDENIPRTGYMFHWVPEWWSWNRIVDLFRLWKTRGFNTPVYNCIYPDIWMKDGEVKTGFSEINQFVAAQQKAGLNGVAICDTFLMEHWAHAAAVRIRSHHGGKIPQKGGVGIFKKEAFWWTEKEPYQELEKELFAEVLKQFDANAKAKNWPHYLVYTSEEIDNQPFKTQDYEFFNPVAVQTLGKDHVMVIDNNVGYYWGGLDRGKRDRLKYRHYNNWDEKALADARNDGAEIWTFNGGNNRAAWGLLIQRQGAVAHTQWADGWNGTSKYLKSVLTGGGKVLTSVDYERAAMGLRDLAVFRELQKQSENSGRQEKYRRILEEISGIVPIHRNDFQALFPTLKDADYEARRFMALQALGEMEGADYSAPPAAAEPALVSAEPLNTDGKQAEPEARVLYVRAAAQLHLDGKADESAYDFGDDFVWNKLKEARERSQAASEEDYMKNRLPKPAQVAAASHEDGLFVAFRMQRWMKEELAANRKNDDPQLWKDDCFEVFLQNTDGDKPDLYHLLVNAADQSVLFKNGKVVTGHGVRVRNFHESSAAYKFTVEICIPWRALGLKHRPQPGERWHFNAGREYHKLSQYTTWAQVYDKFGLGNGYIIFGSPNDKVKKLDIGNPFYGKNRITGTMGGGKYQLQLKSPDGKTETRQVEGDFSIDFIVTPENTGNWELGISDLQGGPVHKVAFACPRQRHDLEVIESSPLVISGDRAYADIEFMIGNRERNFLLHAELVDPSGKAITAKPIKIADARRQRVYLETKGVPAGSYTFRLFTNRKEMGVEGSRPLRVLPPAF